MSEENDADDDNLQQVHEVLEDARSKTCCGRFLSIFKNKNNLLLLLTVSAVAIGVIIGATVKMATKQRVHPNVMTLVSFPGELLMNMLKMLTIPLVMSSLISSLCTLGVQTTKRMGLCTTIYFLSTTCFAVILGIVLVTIIQPGGNYSSAIKDSKSGPINDEFAGPMDSILDIVRNMFPSNIIEACFRQVQSRLKKVKINGTETRKKVLVKEDNTNVLGLLTFSAAFGLILSRLGPRGQVMLEFCNVLNEITMMLVYLIMWYGPIGIISLILSKILSIDDLVNTAKFLGLYMLTVIVGLTIHTLGTLCIIFYLFTRKNPFVYMKGVFQAFVTALGTASSAATLPVTFRCLEENLKIDSRVTRFLLPIGATINMDGTALYEAVAAIFIAQYNGVDLSMGKVITISITATLASIGAASIPGAGLITMVLVLVSVGLPEKDISLIVSVDWFLDRLRTAVNILGDAFGAGIVAHICEKKLAEWDLSQVSEQSEATQQPEMETK